MIRSRLVGCGSYLPQRVMTNEEISVLVDTTPEWIESRTGIRQRHIAAPDELTSDLATQAAQAALLNAQLTPNDIDLIILATTTPDDTFPSGAVSIQRKIGAKNAFAFDIQAVCAGFPYALATADNFIKTGQAKTALVIGAETMSRILDWQDRGTCILFGDGAGAVVLKGEQGDRGILSTHLYADGCYRDILYVDGGAGRSKNVGVIHMSGREVFKHAVEKMGQAILTGLEFNGLSAQDISWFVPHQANLRIINSLAERFSIPQEKLVLCVSEHANTSAASIPLALAHGQDAFKENDLIVLSALGGGLAWGSAVIRW